VNNIFLIVNQITTCVSIISPDYLLWNSIFE